MNLETLTLLYLAIGPGIALAVYIYYSDKWEPEPKALVIKSFVLGGFAVFSSGYIEDSIKTLFDIGPNTLGSGWTRFLFAFLGVALVEEGCKVLFLKAFIYDDREFSEPFDGIVYGGMVGCGFATFENIMYVLSYGSSVGVMRMVTAVPGHVFDGMILGYFVGTAKFSMTPGKYFLKGLILVIFLHGAYNTAAFAQQAWSFYVLFGIVALAIYFGLRGKKELARHSKAIEFSPKQFWLWKNHRKTGPLVLKEIRNRLARGEIQTEDGLIEVESGKQKTISQVFYREIGLKRKALARIPPFKEPLMQVFSFYVLTLGLYLYVWFYKIYRQIRNYKRQELNPELRVLGLFVLTILPFYIYGNLLRVWDQSSLGLPVEIVFYLGISGIEGLFVFVLLQKIYGMIRVKLGRSFHPGTLATLFFLLSALRRSISLDWWGFWYAGVLLILMQAALLVVVQKDLNRYWELETK